MCQFQMCVFAVMNFFIYYIVVVPGMPCTVTYCAKEH